MPDTPNYDAANANAEAIIKARIGSGQFPNPQQLEQIRENELNLAAIEFVNKNPQKAQELTKTDQRLKAVIEKTSSSKTVTSEEKALPFIQESNPSPLSDSIPEAPTKTGPEKSAKTGKKTSRVMILAILILIIIAAVSGIFYMRSQTQLKLLKNNPDEISKQATKEILDKVGKLIILPQDEEPTIATVTDPEKLKDQPFFQKAQKDDKVLIYTKNKKAILYRPSSNQIVDVAPIDNQNSQSPSVSPSPTPKIVASPTPQATSSAKTTR